jgi:AmmeMemoRadiSam system protein B
MMTSDLEDCFEVAQAVADSIKTTPYPVVIVASSDMTHYEPDTEARKKDRLALDMVLALNPEGLYRTVLSKKISMCGYIPTLTMLKASILLGAKSAVLVKYMTSGDVSGDYSHVVGYAGVIIK